MDKLTDPHNADADKTIGSPDKSRQRKDFTSFLKHKRDLEHDIKCRQIELDKDELEIKKARLRLEEEKLKLEREIFEADKKEREERLRVESEENKLMLQLLSTLVHKYS